MKKFAFLIHARDSYDISRRFRLASLLPEVFIKRIMKRLGGRLGFTICSQFRVSEAVEGYIIGVLLTGDQMMSLPLRYVRNRIFDAVLFAQESLGVDLIGLGGLTASVTNGGQWLVQQPGIRATITHGDSFATAIAQEGIEKIIKICGFDKTKTEIAVIGAYGLIGEALTNLLIQEGHKLILIGKSEKKLQRLLEKIDRNHRSPLISTDLASASSADIIVTATSHPTALLKSSHLKIGSIVYDVSQPMNVSERLILQRPDITKVDGSYVAIGDIDIGFDMGTPPHTTFACLAETIMQTIEHDSHNHTGPISMENITKTKIWAKKYGFSHAPFSSFGKPIEEDILRKSFRDEKIRERVDFLRLDNVTEVNSNQRF